MWEGHSFEVCLVVLLFCFQKKGQHHILHKANFCFTLSTNPEPNHLKWFLELFWKLTNIMLDHLSTFIFPLPDAFQLQLPPLFCGAGMGIYSGVTVAISVANSV